jgi:hypothetical protein
MRRAAEETPHANGTAFVWRGLPNVLCSKEIRSYGDDLDVHCLSVTFSPANPGLLKPGGTDNRVLVEKSGTRLLYSSDKALRRAVLRVDEDDAFRVTSRCVEREKDHRLLKNFGQSMHDTTPEEEEVTRRELPSIRSVAHPEGTPPKAHRDTRRCSHDNAEVSPSRRGRPERSQPLRR